MIIEKTPLPLPLDCDVKMQLGDVGERANAHASTAAAALAACEDLGLPPPPAYEDVPLLEHARARTVRRANAQGQDKDLPTVPADSGRKKGKETEHSESEDGGGELKPPGLTPGASSSRIALSLPSTSPSFTISPPLVSTPSVSNIKTTKTTKKDRKGSSGSAGEITSEQRAIVRTTVLGFVRDLVTIPQSTPASSPGGRTDTDVARGVLASCANACRAHGVPFARLLQARSVAGHTPLYWAVINRPLPTHSHHPSEDNSEADAEEDSLLHALLAYAGALGPSSMDDLRAACLAAADNVLLQRLRATPAVNPLRGTDVLLLFGSQANGASNSGILSAAGTGTGAEGVSSAALERYRKGPTFGDCARMAEGGLDESAFRVEVEVDMFQRRMRVTGEVAVEFVARGRLWTLCFFVVKPPGSGTSPSPSSAPNTKTTSSSASNAADTSRIPPAARLAAKARELPVGAWAAALALLPHSPPCALDARLVVAQPAYDSSPLPSPTRPRSQHGFGEGHYDSGSGDFLSAPPPVHTAYPRSASTSNLAFTSRQHSAPTAASTSSLGVRRPSMPFLAHSSSSPRRSSQSAPKAPLVLRLARTLKASADATLIAPAPPAESAANSDESEWDFDLDDDSVSGNAKKPEKKKNTRKERSDARKAERREAARARREELGKETKKERKAQRALAETVLITSLDEAGPGEKEGGGCLMYDNCAYIARDGTLRAVLEARLRGPNTDANADGGCIIC